MIAPRMKKYAIFFPQFHPVEVNNQAWGKGFTDWSLVAAANAFDLWPRRAPRAGFYDLSNPQHIQDRFSEAARSGLDGFGIYHYRFTDGPELDSVERYLARAQLPDNFGFFFIWANESWSRRWAGKDTEIMKTVSQNPAQEEIRAHVAYLAPYLSSGAYTKIMGRPVFVIYRAEFFLDPQATLLLYRQEFTRAGLEPLIGFCLTSPSDVDYSRFFDFCYLFEPRLFFSFQGLRGNPVLSRLFKKLVSSLSYEKVEFFAKTASKLLHRGAKSQTYASFLNYFCSGGRSKLIHQLSCPVQNIVSSGWNNAPRYRQNFTALDAPTIDQFSSLLSHSLNDPVYSKEIPLLCNAWNEWSEGAAIEPCFYLGESLLRAYLDSKT